VRAALAGGGLYTPAQYATARQRLAQYAADASRDAFRVAVPMYQFIYTAESAPRQALEADEKCV
jgi:hypothetical protein